MFEIFIEEKLQKSLMIMFVDISTYLHIHNFQLGSVPPGEILRAKIGSTVEFENIIMSAKNHRNNQISLEMLVIMKR